MNRRLRLGDVCVELLGDVAALCAEWSAFATAETPSWRIDWTGGASDEHATGVMQLHGDESSLLATGDDFTVEVRALERRVIVSGAPGRGLVAALLAVLAREEPDTLPVHASAVETDGRVDVFCAPSGGGKSTLAAGLGNALADEIVLVRREGRGWVASGTPVWQGRPARTPIRGVFLLEHGRLGRRRASVREAMAILARQARLILPDAERQRRTLALVSRLVDEVPVEWLSFGLHDIPDGVRRVCGEVQP